MRIHPHTQTHMIYKRNILQTFILNIVYKKKCFSGHSHIVKHATGRTIRIKFTLLMLLCSAI